MTLTKAEIKILQDLSFATIGGTTFYGSADSLYQAVAVHIFANDIKHPAVNSFREAFNKFNREEIDRHDPKFQKILLSYLENTE